MFIKSLFLTGYFILSLLVTVTLSFGLSFLIVPHHPVDPYKLMEEMTVAGERVASDWWSEVYIPEKHHERFGILGEKRQGVFEILVLMILPFILYGCWLIFIRRWRLTCHTTPAQHST